MILSFDAAQVSKSLAWERVRQKPPEYIHEGAVFRPQHGDFRKDHDLSHWRWIVGIWRPVDKNYSLSTPHQPPPPITDSMGFTHAYAWGTWVDRFKHEEVRSCGFILPWVLANKERTQ